MSSFRINIVFLFLSILFLFTGCNSKIAKLQKENDVLIASNASLKKQIYNLYSAKQKQQKEADNLVITDKNINEVFNKQLITVQKTGIIVQDEQFKTIYPDLMSATIKNNSDDTVKNISIGLLGYDSNGYPVKIKSQMDFLGGAYEKIIKGEGVNIMPMAVYGNKRGLPLNDDNKVKYILACVKSAEFYKRGAWINPYYYYWIKKYKENPVSVDKLKNMYIPSYLDGKLK